MEIFTVEVKTVRCFPEQLLLDIMVTAVEGGINYWAEFRNIQRDAELNVLSFEVKDTEDEDDEWKKVDIETIKQGISTLLTNPAYSHYMATTSLLKENLDLDADDADSIVQMGLFKELVYC